MLPPDQTVVKDNGGGGVDCKVEHGSSSSSSSSSSSQSSEDEEEKEAGRAPSLANLEEQVCYPDNGPHVLYQRHLTIFFMVY